ncbi:MULTISPECIES: SDR family oxidoreductase [Alphaproteobacteria]|uniref:NAD(P)-dependent oxidoreductase n=2 Tax=Alphaproteobacteria TaxID=28211 RepID=A0A512HMU0_9HYPH|nr:MULTISPECIES: SDR family oxidoreductase [Alphaproteobacteria]GEO86766.1 NAD(P)-dependent oxidoreductase [Ciceribacter naphthalenivorans]GLR23345.1 NAD(P)-dependent oxidoreductase [Ciceribacter naphthalenivorans]GLT06201.1 NAD(P)-dependent oxidoreductase [Sphingomonas psychrolutea]
MSKILVTGASGHLGRLVIQNLTDANKVAPSGIVAASRDPGKLADLAARGIETRRVDFDDASSLANAFAGIDRLLIISTDALDRPGRRLEQHTAAVAAAKAAGVGRIFYTSMPKPETSLVSFAPDHAGTEKAIEESGIPYTIFRNGWYMENLLMSLPQSLASGQWYSAADKGKNAYVARADIAAAIAGGLANPESGNAIYTLTGSIALSTEEIAALVTDVSGKPLTVVHLNDEQLAGGMKSAGVPDFLIPMLISFETNTRAGGFDVVTDDVKKLSGRAPLDLKSFLEANKDTLA